MEPKKKASGRTGPTHEALAAEQVTQAAEQASQATEQITQAAEQVTQAAEQVNQANAIAAQSYQILAITDGVQELATHVSILNERVYTKNALDRTRNVLIGWMIATFVVLSIVLGFLLWQINANGRAEVRRARERAAEAVSFRRQLADCTVPPGTVLTDGYVNPGVCFSDTATRTQVTVDEAVTSIETSTRELLARMADAVAANAALTSEVRRVAATQARVLRVPPTTVVSTVVPTTTPATRAPPAAPSPARPTGLLGVLCAVLSLVGAC